MNTTLTRANPLAAKLGLYWTLIKSWQTGLLLITGLAGYMSAHCPMMHWTTLSSVAGSLFLAISGSTMLNMVYDCDIDSKMLRTCERPLPSDRINLGLFKYASAYMLGSMLLVRASGLVKRGGCHKSRSYSWCFWHSGCQPFAIFHSPFAVL